VLQVLHGMFGLVAHHRTGDDGFLPLIVIINFSHGYIELPVQAR